jgi:ABC-2 type transport system ATP-binding protein
MSTDPVEVTEATLVYKLPIHDASSVRELFTKVLHKRPPPRTVRALDGVSFSVGRGEVLAIIGSNGAGKSTLMKLMARVLPPTNGRVVVRGHISPMIELGAGFNFEQTARENIVLYGTLLGRRPEHMQKRCEPIIEWAQLGDYMDVPLRSFSSGMVARLAFSIATDVQPDVLLIDEVLAVGDDVFRERSSERIDRLISSGAAVILVTHSMPEVTNRAHRALYLKSGHIAMIGDPKAVVATYLDTARSEDQERA